ncbi:MAG: ribulokinase [Phycisphaerae bacterium]|nr:ribulokinase [Phycisphaerae bacterium]
MAKYTIGLDYGTNSVRAILVNVADGREIASAAWTYAHGKEGILLSGDPNLARQHPADYLKGAETTIKRALAAAKRSVKTFKPDHVIGLGVDTTGSTPIPVDRKGQPLAMDPRFAKDLDAMAWLWKDHTSFAEAEEITDLARKMRPQYLAKCGGVYSSEWFFSKILHCLRTNPKVFSAAYTWVEAADWIPAVLSGTEAPEDLKICVCAAGHKAMFNADWGGYPDEKFLARLDPKLGGLHVRLKTRAQTIDTSVGELSKAWASKTGLPAGIPVATGVFDAHAGAVGSGIEPGTLVKILGTSTCDMMIVPAGQPLADIPGLCGIVKGSVVPGFIGLEAGQSAVGDIFNWYVDVIRPGGAKSGSHAALTKEADKLAPGASGLLALDWNHGNRTVLVDPRLSGLLVGQSLHTTPAEVYRALVEATAFGALTIINRLEQYHVKVERIVTGGGIAEKNPMVMQIYADVTNRPMMLSRSSQTCALGAAVAAAVCAGAHESIPAAQKAMTGLKTKVYQPNPPAVAVYKKLYVLYKQLHDAFGTTAWKGSCHNVMKDLLDLRAQARGS